MERIYHRRRDFSPIRNFVNWRLSEERSQISVARDSKQFGHWLTGLQTKTLEYEDKICKPNVSVCCLKDAYRGRFAVILLTK